MHGHLETYLAFVDAKESTRQTYRKALESFFRFVTDGLGQSGDRASTRTIQDICKKALRAIDLDSHEYSAHSLRHTTGTQILLNGGIMFDVQAVLRHATPTTSQLY